MRWDPPDPRRHCSLATLGQAERDRLERRRGAEVRPALDLGAHAQGLFRCSPIARPPRRFASGSDEKYVADLTSQTDEQRRRRGASQTAAPAGHCTSRRARGGSSQLLCEAKQPRPLTAPCLLRPAAAGCQQVPAVTPALRWIGSEQQSEPPASRCPFATRRESSAATGLKEAANSRRRRCSRGAEGPMPAALRADGPGESPERRRRCQNRSGAPGCRA